MKRNKAGGKKELLHIGEKLVEAAFSAATPTARRGILQFSVDTP